VQTDFNPVRQYLAKINVAFKFLNSASRNRQLLKVVSNDCILQVGERGFLPAWRKGGCVTAHALRKRKIL
jgi:hypothetical protein